MIWNLPNIKVLVDLHNEERKRKNKPILESNAKLMRYAQDWAINMAEKGSMYHSKMSNISTLGFSIVAENIAYGQKTEQSVMDTWMRSYGHRNNILNGKFNSIGAGYYYSQKDIIYWCVCFGKTKD